MASTFNRLRVAFARLYAGITPRRIGEWSLINAGLFLMALGIALFKSPNRFATGGVAGAAIIAQSYMPHLRVGIFMAVINAALVVVAFGTLGKSVTLRTMVAGFLLSLYTWLIEEAIPLSAPFTDERLLELAFAIMLPAVGSAIVFNLNASTGGTDILALILSRYTRITIGHALLVTDFLITLGAMLAFGVETGLYCILGLVLRTTLVDVVIDSINVRKCFVIISDRHEEIARFIIERIHRGATIHEAQGAFSHRTRYVITTAISRGQAVMLRDFIRRIDPAAFITITNSSEIIGKGFMIL